jgi:hypothetical protein
VLSIKSRLFHFIEIGMRNELNYCRRTRSRSLAASTCRTNHAFRPVLGFKKFYNARRVVIGVELLQKLNTGQYPIHAPSAAHWMQSGAMCSLLMVNAIQPVHTLSQKPVHCVLVALVQGVAATSPLKDN